MLEALFRRSSKTSSGSGSGSGSSWQQASLDAHNKRRAAHGAPPLTWSDECYQEAKKQADDCQRRRALGHSHLTGPSGRHGQNAYWCSAPVSDVDDVVASWYKELTDHGYNYGNPTNTHQTGHFTQVVWQSTRQVGVAQSADGCFVVANYFPAGNVVGQYPKEVLPPRGGQPLPPPPKKAPATAPQPPTRQPVSSPNPTVFPTPSGVTPHPATRQSVQASSANPTAYPTGSPGQPGVAPAAGRTWQPMRLLQGAQAPPAHPATAGTKESVQVVQANGLTKEVIDIFKECPFDFLEKVKPDLAKGTSITVTLTKSPGTNRIEVKLPLREFKGSWSS